MRIKNENKRNTETNIASIKKCPSVFKLFETLKFTIENKIKVIKVKFKILKLLKLNLRY